MAREKTRDSSEIQMVDEMPRANLGIPRQIEVTTEHSRGNCSIATGFQRAAGRSNLN